jgi:putative transposase
VQSAEDQDPAKDTDPRVQNSDLHRPPRAPQANAYAERWVRTVRIECLDWLLIFNVHHLQQVLDRYLTHYNAARPHRGNELTAPIATTQPTPPSTAQIRRIERDDLLGGLVHEYRHAA